MEDTEYIKNLNIMQRAFKDKNNKEIERLINFIADEEAKLIKNKSS